MDPLDRLEELLSAQEETIRRAFTEFVRNVNAPEAVAAITERLEAGDLEGALAIVDSYAVRFANVLPTIQQVVGTATAAELAQIASEFAIAISFDSSHPRAAALARANRLELVREFTTEQRAATREAIVRSFETGEGTASTARAFRNSIGLNRVQERWVASFETALRNRDRKALDRALRDRRFDRTVERAFEAKRPLTELQIQRMTERYRARTLIMRSENIARTEALRATSGAREEALLQMIEQTGLPPERIRRVWNATRDARTRDAHRPMNGQEREIGASFEDGDGNALRWPGDPQAPAGTTINCRCTLTFRVLPPA